MTNLLNLYKFHSNEQSLVGHRQRSSNPVVVFDNASEMFRSYYTTPADVAERITAQFLIKNCDVLGRDAKVAVEATRLYRQIKGYRADTVEPLFPRGSAAVKNIAQNPNLITEYVREVIQHVTPEYHDQILKADPKLIARYVEDYPDTLATRHREFLDKAFTRLSESPQQAFEVAVVSFAHERVPGLELGIFNYEPNRQDWNNSRPESVRYAETPAINTARPSALYSDTFGEFDSPWNLYVSGLSTSRERRRAVARYGFKGREFDLGDD